MNLELVKDKMTDARAQAHLKDQLNKLLVSNNKDWHRTKRKRPILLKFFSF